MADTEELVEKLEKARHRVRDIVAHAQKDARVYPKWRIKEFIDHLTGWDDAMIATMQAHLEGRETPMIALRGVDYYNEGTVSERSTLDLEHSLLEWEATRSEVIRLIRMYTLEKAVEAFTFPWGETGDLTDFVNIFIHHENEHADEVRANLARGEPV